MKKTVIAVIMVTAAVVGGVWYLTYRKSIVTIKQSHVIERGVVTSTVSSASAGTVLSEREATVSSEYVGRIAGIMYDAGDFVEKGEVVLVFEDGSALANVKLSKASLAGGESAFRQAKLSEMVAGVVKPAEIERAEVLFKTALETFKRAEELYSDGVISKQALESIESEMESAEMTRDSVKTGDMDREIQEELVNFAEANVDQLKATVELAEEELNKCSVRAPFSGVISKKFVETGEIAPFGTPLFHIIDTNNLKIIAPIDEVDAGKLRIGAHTDITLDAHADREFSEKVSKIAPVVTTDLDKSRTVEIEIKITKDVEMYTVGMSADVILVLGSHEDVVSIPTNAVFERKGQKQAWVMERGKVYPRDITLGLENWDSSEVMEGLEVGETIVLALEEGKLKDGAPYRMSETK